MLEVHADYSCSIRLLFLNNVWVCFLEVRGFLPARYLSPLPPTVSRSNNQLLRPESAASMASSAASGASGNSNSMESLNEEVHLMERAEQSHEDDDNFYDLPPSYEEALGKEEAQSPHRYCEIDDLVEDPNSTEMGAAYNTPEKAESPIYAVIEDIISSSKEKKEDVPSTENNVWMLL